MSEAPRWIGRRMPRREAGRLASGKGRYTDDIATADVGHVAFLRSPHSHAGIGVIAVTAAKAAAGVIAVVTGDHLAAVCTPWQTRLAPLPRPGSAPAQSLPP